MAGNEHDRAYDKLQRTMPLSKRDPRDGAPPTDSVARAQRLQTDLSRLRGIREARVVATADGAKVTVLTLPERREEDTVSDVRTLANRAGIDPSGLRVRVLGATTHGTPMPRRKLSSLSTKRYSQRFTAQVTLELEGDALVGEVDVPVGRRFEYRSVARAVLESVRSLIPFALQLENVEIFNYGAERLAVVSVSSRQDLLIGSALVRVDELDAIARATLDAINRVLNLGPIDLPRGEQAARSPV